MGCEYYPIVVCTQPCNTGPSVSADVNNNTREEVGENDCKLLCMVINVLVIIHIFWKQASAIALCL